MALSLPIMNPASDLRTVCYADSQHHQSEKECCHTETYAVYPGYAI